jgi:hypothetical protein
MNDEQDQLSKFIGIDLVIADSRVFWKKLAIGEGAYSSLEGPHSYRIIGLMLDLTRDGFWTHASSAQRRDRDVLWNFHFRGLSDPFTLGIGPTATTPIGWVMRAAVITGGTYHGVVRHFHLRNELIPSFISTPVDLLGACLLDLIGSWSIRLAIMNASFTDDERAAIKGYLIEEWGYSPPYVDQALFLIEQNIHQLSLGQMLESFSTFAKANPDCNFSVMRQELLLSLDGMVRTDGKVDEKMASEAEFLDQIESPADIGWARMKLLGQVAVSASRPGYFEDWLRECWSKPWAVKTMIDKPN